MSEQACVLAALILHDGEVEISADKIKAIVTAAGIEVESYWPTLFEKFLANQDIGDMLSNPEPEPEEEEEEEDMGFDLFD
eukprot:PRCOL_00001437-RA